MTYQSNHNTGENASHRFDACAWRTIKEFSGIYGVKLPYNRIKNISKAKLSDAYFNDAKLPPISAAVTLTIEYNSLGEAVWNRKTRDKFRDANTTRSATEWKATILKRAAQGYKNREFYEALAKILQPRKRCLCGAMVSVGAMNEHYQTKSHINEMVQCVPVSKLTPENAAAYKVMLPVRVLNADPDHAPRRSEMRLVNLKIFMKLREHVERHVRHLRGYSMDANILIEQMIKKAGGHNYESILEGKWQWVEVNA